jgi:hypothetical protein
MVIDWTKIYDKYKGRWVALEDDQKTVISTGKTAKEALVRAKAKGRNEPVLFRVPTEILPYVGNFSV